MQPERQISVALVVVSAAIVAPAFHALSRDPNAVPGAALAIGSILGSLGILMGSLLAVGHPETSARIVGLAFWIVLALALGYATWLGAVHSTSWLNRVLFGVAGLLPAVGPILALRSRRS